MKKQLFLFLITFSCISTRIHCQEIDKILALPTSAEIGNFGRTPVGLFTGTNQVSIPLYELKTKNLTFPINLNYSSNGFIVDKIASRYGYDWTLSAEGVVIRVIRGMPDDTQQFTLFPANLDTLHNFTSLEISAITNYFQNWNFYGYDSEPDIYSFNFCGYSGQCYRDYEHNKMITIPYGDLNINLIERFKDTFSIFDAGGIKYFFEAGEKSIYETGGDGEQTVSAYYLSKIIHPLGDSIVLNYTSTQVTAFRYGTSISDAVSYAQYMGNEGYCPSSSYQPFTGPTYNLSELTGHYKSLNSIIAPGYGTIVFHWEQDRLDFIEPRLSWMAVVDETGDTLRKVSLHHFFLNTSNEYNINLEYNYVDSDERFYRMFLDSIFIKDKNNNSVQKYAFEYNNVTQSSPSQLPSRLTYAQDHWGYFNGIDNFSLLPDSIPLSVKQDWFPNLESTRTIANRSANYLYAQKGILSKITFPTRGYTEYDYEAHRSVGHPNEEHGGVRLKQQRSYSATGQLAFKNTYKYSGGHAGWDRDNLKYYYDDYTIKFCCYDYNEFIDAYVGNTSFQTFVLKSSPLYSLFLNGGAYIGYEKVTVYHGDSISNSGKEEHEFEIGFDDYYPELLYEESSGNDPFLPRPYINYGWKNGTKLKEKYYKNNSGIYTPVKEIIYGYNEDAANNVVNFYPSVQCDDFEDVHCGPPLTHAAIDDRFRVSLYWYISKWRYLSTKVENLYNDNGSIMIADTTRYYYDNPNHAQLTRTEKRLSNNNIQVLKTRYPTDINAGVYSYMKSKHMLNYPIEQTTILNNRFTASTLTTYKPGGGSYVPDKVYSWETTSSLPSFTYFNGTTKDSHYGSSPEIEFNNYSSKGNILQTTEKNGIVTSYLWGYSDTYPIIKAENVSYSNLTSAANSAAISAGSTDITDLISDIGYLTSSTQRTKWKNFNTALRNNTNLQNAIVTSYSYKPLVGIVSQSDPTGTVTYYTYDSFGRLEYIKDHDDKLIKRYGYHYAGQ